VREDPRRLSRDIYRGGARDKFDDTMDRARTRPRDRDLHFSTKSGSGYCYSCYSAKLAESSCSSLFALQPMQRSPIRASFSAEARSSPNSNAGTFDISFDRRTNGKIEERERASRLRRGISKRCPSSSPPCHPRHPCLPSPPRPFSSRSFYSGDPPLEARMETTVIEINISFWKGRAPFAW
jgi:hypothetical protein